MARKPPSARQLAAQKKFTACARQTKGQSAEKRRKTVKDCMAAETK